MNYNNLTVAGLREELKTRDVSRTGIKLKKDLVARLQQDDTARANANPDASNSVVKAEANLDSSATIEAEDHVDLPAIAVRTETPYVPPPPREPSEYGSDDLFDELDAANT
jgi:hypothetical protein